MLFKKKDKNQEKNKVKNETYRIIIKDRLGNQTKTIVTFEATRHLDEEENIDYLRNTSKKFLEIFPQDENLNIVLNKRELDSKVVSLKKALKQEEINDDPEINQKDLEFELNKYEAQLRYLEYGENKPYISFGEDGVPEIIYLRIGTMRIPFKWDISTKNIYIPSDNKKKTANLLLRNKENKYKSKNLIETSTVILLIIGLILTVGNVFGGFKLWTAYDDSNIAEYERSSLEAIDVCSNVLKENAKVINDIVQETKQEPVKETPTTIINGFIPE